MAVPARKQDRYTYADNLTWDDDVRRELIDGEVFVMSPAPRRVHQGLLGALYLQVATEFEESDGRARSHRTVRRPPAEGGRWGGDEDTVVQPDLVVISDESKLDERGEF